MWVLRKVAGVVAKFEDKRAESEANKAENGHKRKTRLDKRLGGWELPKYPELNLGSGTEQSHANGTMLA